MTLWGLVQYDVNEPEWSILIEVSCPPEMVFVNPELPSSIFIWRKSLDPCDIRIVISMYKHKIIVQAKAKSRTKGETKKNSCCFVFASPRGEVLCFRCLYAYVARVNQVLNHQPENQTTIRSRLKVSQYSKMKCMK